MGEMKWKRESKTHIENISLRGDDFGTAITLSNDREKGKSERKKEILSDKIKCGIKCISSGTGTVAHTHTYGVSEYCLDLLNDSNIQNTAREFDGMARTVFIYLSVRPSVRPSLCNSILMANQSVIIL